jgi:hypothetical protein
MRFLFPATLVMAVLATQSTAAGPPEFPRIRSLLGLKKKDETPGKTKQLLDTLKSDTDEKKRKAAAEDLAEVDPRGNEVIPGLIASLRQDPSVSVRSAAAESIGKLKPVSAQAGVALEEAVQTDPSEGVRKAAQGALFQYHLNGYKASPAGTVQTAEPPLAKSKGKTPPPAVTVSRLNPTPPVTPAVRGAQTTEPPLAKPPVTPAPGPTVTPPSDATAPPGGVPTVVPPPVPDTLPIIPKIPGSGE